MAFAGALLLLTLGSAAASTPTRECAGDAKAASGAACRPGPPSAVFTWSVARIHVRAGNDVTNDRPDTSSTGALALDGCASDSGDPHHRLSGYRWKVLNAQGSPVQVLGQGCRVSVTRPLSDRWQTWNVTLTVVRSGDRATDSEHQAVRFRDLLIASIGDSAASGEGNPDVPTSYTLIGTVAHLAAWNNARCDRSGRAATAQLALNIERSDPGTSITFWPLACSGAAIEAPYPEWLDPIDGGLITTYDGERRPSGVHYPLPPQVDELATLVGQAHRPIDALLITAGANDVNWSALTKECYTHPACVRDWQGRINAALGPNGFLPSRLADLHKRIAALNVVSPGRVFMTDYWDPTVDNQRGSPAPGFSRHCAADPLAPNWTNRKWGHDHILVPMNNIIKQAVTGNGWAWNFIGGIGQLFAGHGLCSTGNARWIVSLEDSIREQGHGEFLRHILSSLLPVVYPAGSPAFGLLWADWEKVPVDGLTNSADLNGAWHANGAGQEAIAQKEQAAMGSVLNGPGYQPPSIQVSSSPSGTIIAGTPVTLTATVSSDSGDPTSVTWSDSAQGNLGSGTVITPSLLGAGTHTVTGTVQDLISGQTAAASLVLTVTNPPTFALTLNIGSALNGESVTTADGRNQCNVVQGGGQTCIFNYPPGATVTLTQHVIGGWNGYWGSGPGTLCFTDDQPSCTVVMSGPETVYANLHGFS